MKSSIVLIGGGHGLSNLVKGFCDSDIDLNVVVSSTDDGGHTGKIRDEFNSVAVGDLRMVLDQLIDEKSALKEVFNYRFDSLHGTNSVSLGNLIIASLWEKYIDIDKVIGYFKEKEKFSANVFLSSNNSLTLCAQSGDDVIKCERLIGTSNKKINNLFVEGKAICNKNMLEKIENADIIVLSPGSLFTSVGAVLCIDQIKEAIKNSGATIVYVCNIMSQDGETRGFKVEDHVDALERIMDKSIDRVIVNNGKIPEKILERYKEENSEIVSFNENRKNYEFYDVVEIKDYKVRHNSDSVKKIILNQ